MNKTGRNAKRYLRAVKRWMPCSGKLKRGIMAQIDNCVQEYMEKNPNASFDDICAQLGSPQEIAAAYIENADTAEILKNLRVRRRIVTIVISAILVILISWASVVIYEIVDFEKMVNGGIVVDTDIIEEITIE